MATSKFQVKLAESFLLELFGNQQIKNPLLRKNISQKVKFHLKKLGKALENDYNEVKMQLRDLQTKYSHEVENEVVNPNDPEGPKIKEVSKQLNPEFRDQFLKEATELEEMDLSIDHYNFTEEDFIDESTGKIVASDIYFNIIDVLIYDKLEEQEEEKQLEATKH